MNQEIQFSMQSFSRFPQQVLNCLGERSEAYSHMHTAKWFRFFPFRDIPLRFISLNVIFSVAIGRIYPIFITTLRRVHDLSFNSKFSAA